MTRTGNARRAAASVAAGCIGLLLLAAPASAQTYSKTQDNTTNQPEDDNSGGSNDTGNDGSNTGNDGSNTGNDGTNNGGTDNGGTTPDDATTPDGNSGTPTDGTPVGQVDEDLAFTGSDARSLALIGAGVAGAGALLIVATRRRETELA